MDEKTEQLRDIFVEVTDEETVTESQADERGSLVPPDEEAVTERLRSVLERMRDDESFRTDLDLPTYVDLVTGFYEGDDDETLAATLGLPESDVFAARMDCHLFRSVDAEPPLDPERLAAAVGEDRSLAALSDDELAAVADDVETDASALHRYRETLRARDAARRASHRYQDAFEDVLTDADLAENLTESAREDGLREAAEDIETDLSL